MMCMVSGRLKDVKLSNAKNLIMKTETQIPDEIRPLTIHNVSGSACPFVLGEIAVFESWFRFEIYISRVQQIHIDYWWQGGIPKITKATLEQKKQWWDSGEYEVVIEELHCR